MTLKQKIFIPIIAVLLGLGTLGYWLTLIALEDLKTTVYGAAVRNKQAEIQAALNLASQQALSQAALFTRLPTVQAAYTLANSGNLDDEADAKGQQAREALRSALQGTVAGYRSLFPNEELKLHFHLHNARSLLRLWLPKQTRRNGLWQDVSDDLSSFRPLVVEVNRTHQARHGIELGREGFMIRGVAPIQSDDGKSLGTVEALSSFEKVLDQLSQPRSTDTTGQQGLFLYMYSSHLAVTTQLQDAQRYPVLAERYVSVHATGNRDSQTLIDADLLDQGREQAFVWRQGDIGLGVFPIHDYQGSALGVIAYTFEIKAEERLMQQVALTLFGILVTLLILLSALVFLITARAIIRPINRIIQFSERVKTGDTQITLALDGADEIAQLGTAINHLVLQQRQVLSQIHRAGVQVTSSATQLAASAKQHRATMLMQVDSTQQVLASVASISAISGQLVHTMEEVALMSSETSEFASSGQQDLSSMKTAMSDMEDASKSISSRLEAINAKTRNITSVVVTITKVAEQTNLLSLNAAIEAEKAGEYGQGFNVVAREIRRLADQTAVATLDIERMVKEMQSAVSAGVAEMDRFINVVRHGAEDVGNIGKQLSRIIAQVQALSPRFGEVKTAMAQQSVNAQKINQEMAEFGDSVTQTAAALDESFQAIEQLNQAARGMQAEVERFREATLSNQPKRIITYRGHTWMENE